MENSLFRFKLDEFDFGPLEQDQLELGMCIRISHVLARTCILHLASRNILMCHTSRRPVKRPVDPRIESRVRVSELELKPHPYWLPLSGH